MVGNPVYIAPNHDIDRILQSVCLLQNRFQLGPLIVLGDEKQRAQNSFLVAKMVIDRSYAIAGGLEYQATSTKVLRQPRGLT